ncbi:MAG: hypothetical protein K1X54_05830 [Flavobacteriales bacterium]|nr:hypothetical protein [Flavobacteriales bacterium]
MPTPIRLFTIASLFIAGLANGQPVPASDENIPFLVTFGNEAGTKWGDDDYSQTFFFKIKKEFKDPIYFRVYDPECAGQNDEVNGSFNTMTKFSVYGGAGCITHPDATGIDPIGNYKSGNMLATKTFAQKTEYDGGWYTFGPFNPSEGEYSQKYGGYIFKIICEGLKGDDGNLYRYFLSTNAEKNVPVEGGNAFTFEYTFRLHKEAYQTSHIYPYIDDKVISVEQRNFDWDSDGYIKICSVATLGDDVALSADNSWSNSVYKIQDKERGKSLDIQFTKNDKIQVNNNNVVFSIRNQYGELLPFYVVPIGGVPKYQGNISAKPIKKK